MLSYLHAFHAGNFADVQKHAALTLALTMMQAKKTPIACFDTHAGSALYDLAGERARKTGEADFGVQKLWQWREQLVSPDWRPMLEVLVGYNSDEQSLTRYPGSPAWLASLCRQGDSVTAFELHPSEGQQLSVWAQKNSVRVLHQDGLNGLLQKLPPPQPRLLTLIDPSYEIKTDYEAVASTLIKAWNKCRHGVYLVWYPILTSGLERGLLNTLEAGPVRKVLRSEVLLDQVPERGMVGSGMLVVNPPWGFDQRLTAMMDELKSEQRLRVSHVMKWLVPE